MSSAVVRGFVGAVGNTPLVRLGTLSAMTGREILAKAEWMNPGSSVKDRAALGIVQHALEGGRLRAGSGTVTEGTAGNTGIGLAHVCRAYGLGLVVYMPDTQSQEKMDTLRALGAEVHPVPVVPYDDPNNFNHLARRHAEEGGDGYVWGDQFDNTAGNRDAHYRTTGPEIWEQSGGRVDGFVCATGTGGTLAGVARYLKERSDGAARVWLADPPGSVLHNWFSRGVMGERSPGSSITEGIGQGRVTANLEGAPVDSCICVEDADTVRTLFHLLHREGIALGASSALNVAAAVRMAADMPEGSTVVTIMCDSASRYQSRLFSRSWLEGRGLLDAAQAGIGDDSFDVGRYLSK